MTKEKLSEYVKMLEQDLLELPGQPYSRCAACNKIGLTHNMLRREYLGAGFCCCDNEECAGHADELCAYYYDSRISA